MSDFPAGLEEAYDRFETLIRLYRDSGQEESDGHHAESLFAFALAAEIEAHQLESIVDRIEDLMDQATDLPGLGEGIMLGTIIGYLGGVERRLASENA